MPVKDLDRLWMFCHHIVNNHLGSNRIRHVTYPRLIIPRATARVAQYASTSQPLVILPRPYGSFGLLLDFPASVDAYWATARVAPTTFLVFCRFELKDNSDLSTQIL